MTGFLGGDPPPWCASGIGRKFFYDLAALDPEALEGSLDSMVNGDSGGG